MYLELEWLYVCIMRFLLYVHLCPFFRYFQNKVPLPLQSISDPVTLAAISWPPLYNQYYDVLYNTSFALWGVINWKHLGSTNRLGISSVSHASWTKIQRLVKYCMYVSIVIEVMKFLWCLALTWTPALHQDQDDYQNSQELLVSFMWR